MKIAHLSDLHFAKITYSPLQFLSKRWVGNANLILFRRKQHQTALLAPLPSLFEKLKVNVILITGDLSTTGRDIEFEEGEEFLNSLKINKIVIPGNHDHYTKRGYRKKLFYQFFSNTPLYPPTTSLEKLTLQEDKIELRPLNDTWWYLAIDTAIPTSLVSSRGLFSKDLEKDLQKVLKNLPKGKKVLFLNHFPFFPFDRSKNILQRGMALHNLLKNYPQVVFYLHGHTHRHCIADLREANLPIILDSGSVSLKSRGSFNLLELKEKSTCLSVYHYQGEKWEKKREKKF